MHRRDYDKGTITALQSRTGTKADGGFGPLTLGAMARFYETYVEGKNLSWAAFKLLWDNNQALARPEISPNVASLNAYDIRRLQAEHPDKVFIPDISHYKGVIDWNKAKATGSLGGMITRMTMGRTDQDKTWERNWNECRALDVPCGAYHLGNLVWYRNSRKKTGVYRTDARGGAQHMLDTMPADWEIPPALDIEINLLDEGLAFLSAQEALHWLLEWFEVMEDATGIPPLHYVDVDRMLNRLGRCNPVDLAKLARFGIWNPVYIGREETAKQRTKSIKITGDPYKWPDVGGWSLALWQFCSWLFWPGIDFRDGCDGNFYNGTKAEWAVYLEATAEARTDI